MTQDDSLSKSERAASIAVAVVRPPGKSRQTDSKRPRIQARCCRLLCPSCAAGAGEKTRGELVVVTVSAPASERELSAGCCCLLVEHQSAAADQRETRLFSLSFSRRSLAFLLSLVLTGERQDGERLLSTRFGSIKALATPDQRELRCCLSSIARSFFLLRQPPLTHPFSLSPLSPPLLTRNPF